MNKYRIALINKRLNFRRFLDVIADTAIAAASKAKLQLKGFGYDEVESCTLIEFLG